MSEETVEATYAGTAAAYIPRLGAHVAPGDTLTIPASMADEMGDLWRPAKAKRAARADDEKEPQTP